MNPQQLPKVPELLSFFFLILSRSPNPIRFISVAFPCNATFDASFFTLSHLPSNLSPRDAMPDGGQRLLQPHQGAETVMSRID